MAADSSAGVCVLCGAVTAVVFSHDGHGIVDCNSCAHRQAGLLATVDTPAHVASVYGDDYFTGGGAGYSDYLAERTLLRKRGMKYGRLLAAHGVPGRLLDVGAAAGFLLEGLNSVGWRGVGVEPNAGMAAHARQVVGVDVTTCAFEEYRLDGTDRFDAIVMIQVLAHVIDPLAVLRHAASLIRPGGLLLVETWDRNSRTARLLGQRWHEYSPPSVVQWFTRAGLDALAPGCGFAAESHGRMFKWIGAQHAASLLAYRGGLPSDGAVAGAFPAERSRRHRSPLARVADRIPASFALPYPSEDLFWTLWRRTA